MEKWVFGAVVAVAAAVGLGWSGPAQAGGDTGHRTVCEIAARNLTPAAAAEVRRLLGSHDDILRGNPSNAEVGWACTYPDNIVSGGPGRRSPEHYVNYPRSAVAVTSAAGCGAASACILSAIANDLERLASPALSDRERAEALVYLGHWFGDVHQPLHSSFADDRGGNEINVRSLCRGKLHSAWDTCLVERMVGDDPEDAALRAVAAQWSEAAGDRERAAWLSSEPWQWAAES